MLLPLSMYSIVDPFWVILMSTAILIMCFVYQIYYDHKFVLLDIDIELEADADVPVQTRVINPNEFSLFTVKKTMSYFIREKLFVFIIGIALILLYSIMFPFISSNL